MNILSQKDQNAIKETLRVRSTGKRAGSLRTDIHRPGQIQPHLYKIVGSYYIGSHMIPWDLENLRTLRAMIAEFETSEERADFQADVYGEFGKCGVCGARFAEGEIWKHEETLDLVHMGHDCADKYGLAGHMPGWSSVQAMREQAKKAAKTLARNSGEVARIEKQYPGIREALETSHSIVRDIKSRFEGSNPFLSEKQIALVFKLAGEAKARAALPQEAKVPAPVSDKRQTVRGTIVSLKTQASDFGDRSVMTVKIETPNGIWLCWGTRPSFVGEVDAQGMITDATRLSRGDMVEFDCRLEEGKDPSFAFIKRPTKASILTRASDVAKV